MMCPSSTVEFVIFDFYHNKNLIYLPMKTTGIRPKKTFYFKVPDSSNSLNDSYQSGTALDQCLYHFSWVFRDLNRADVFVIVKKT